MFCQYWENWRCHMCLTSGSRIPESVELVQWTYKVVTMVWGASRYVGTLLSKLQSFQPPIQVYLGSLSVRCLQRLVVKLQFGHDSHYSLWMNLLGLWQGTDLACPHLRWPRVSKETAELWIFSSLMWTLDKIVMNLWSWDVEFTWW